MICEICGKQYSYSCPSCTKRVITWGEDGYEVLRKIARESKDLPAEEMIKIALKYYRGKVKNRSDIANVTRTALKGLGYKGNIIGRIHKNGTKYIQLRRREHEAGKRYRLKKDVCDKCGETEDLYLHHILPISWGGTSTPENCITLCKTCHEKVHKKLSKKFNRSLILKYISPHKQELEEKAKESIIL